MKRIAQIGTFNVDNLGDLLFPVIFRSILGEISRSLNVECQIEIFSPNVYGYKRTYSDQIEVRDLLDFDNYSFDLTFIGGGDLLRSDDWSINRIYNYDGLSFSFIASPTNKQIGGLYTLGVGVPFELEEGFSEYLKNSFLRYNGISVRDTLSRDLLAYHGISSEIVPDMVVTISKFYPKKVIESNVIASISRNNYQIRPGKYVVFQANDSVLKDNDIKKLGMLLNDLSRSLNVPIVLLSIGECLGDNILFEKLYPLLENSYVFNKAKDPKLTLIDKVSIIANSMGFIGSSLHGNIISFSYNVPFITFTGEYSTKISGFFKLTNNEKYCFKNPKELLDSNISSIIDYFKTRICNNRAIENYTNIVIDYIKRAMLDSNDSERIFSYSSKIDQLFKIEHGTIVKKNIEITKLWERVNSSEERAKQLERVNSELWERVSISEQKHIENLNQIDALWKRVNESETSVGIQGKQIDELWERVYTSESEDSKLRQKIQEAESEIQNLIIQNQILTKIKEDYEKTLFYRIKNKLKIKRN